MIVFRLTKTEYAYDLTGKGAEQSGGRWNHKGVPVIYTCESRALCVTEVAVHIPLHIVPRDYSMVEIEIPDKVKSFDIDPDKLEKIWKAFPYRPYTKEILHQHLISQKHLIYKVPSAVVQGSWNYLINPRHKDIGLIKIKTVEDFGFDQRLFT
ncbi:MAG: RES domain-containing protein [Saprospiraceae bacterium]|nr:RES domain-containing protein [Saprospiraceae bacterium]